mgnify:CR=1 FL=1
MGKAPEDIALLPPTVNSGSNPDQGPRKFSEIKQSANVTQPDTGIDYHTMTVTQVLPALGAREGGLADQVGAQALLLNGKNEMTPPPKVGLFRRFLGKLFSSFSIILIVSGLLCYIISGITACGSEMCCQRRKGMRCENIYGREGSKPVRK